MESSEGQYIGDFTTVCEKCDSEIPIGVFAFLGQNDDGTMRVWCDMDVAEVWSHSWACTGEGE